MTHARSRHDRVGSTHQAHHRGQWFDHRADERKKRALYVSAYANQLFGGAPGTSYHDVLVHAGLVDAAEGKFTGHYDPEQLLELDPELIVANEGTREALCRVGGLVRLRACQRDGAGS